MKLQPGLVFAGLLALGLSTYSCANGDTVSGSAGSGGDNGSGSGGSSSGGTTGSGGSSKGGSTGSGGSSKGGSTGSGGSVSSGGTTGSGGSSKGGTTGSGGNISNSGGTTGSGGNVSSSGGTSGSTGAGGSTAISCGPTFSANTGGWVLAPASGGGCWHGYAFAFTETPNCGSTVMPKDFSACTANCALSIMGSVAAATAPSYCGVAGMGFAINQAQGATSGTSTAPTGTGLKVTFTQSTGSNPFRIQLRDDATATNWCYDATTATSPVMVPYTSFNTQCWTGGAGTAYAKQPFTSVQLLVAGGSAAANYSITMTSVTEY